MVEVKDQIQGLNPETSNESSLPNKEEIKSFDNTKDKSKSNEKNNEKSNEKNNEMNVSSGNNEIKESNKNEKMNKQLQVEYEPVEETKKETTDMSQEQVKELTQTNSEITGNNNLLEYTQQSKGKLYEIVSQFMKEKNQERNYLGIIETIQQLNQLHGLPINKNLQKYLKEEPIDYYQRKQQIFESIHGFKFFLLCITRLSSFRLLLLDTLDFFHLIIHQEEIEINELNKPVHGTMYSKLQPMFDSNKSIEYNLYERFKSIIQIYYENEMNRLAFDGLLNFLDNINFFMFEQPEKHEKIQQMKTSEHFYQLLSQVKSFIVSWCNEEEWNNLIQSLKDLLSSIDQDKVFIALIQEMEQIMKRFIFNPILILNESDSKDVTCEILRFKNQRSVAEISEFISNAQNIIKSMEKDEISSVIPQDAFTILRDCFFSCNGKFMRFKPDSIHKLKQLVVGMVKDNLQNLTFSDIDDSRNEATFILSDIKLQILNETIDDSMIITTSESVSNLLFTEDSIVDSINNKISQKVNLFIKGINCSWKGGKYSYKRSKYPKIKDSGNLNIKSTSDLNIHISFHVNTSKEQIFIPGEVNAQLKDNLKINLSKSKNHKYLMKMVENVNEEKATQLICKTLNQSIHNSVFDVFIRLNQLCYWVLQLSTLSSNTSSTHSTLSNKNQSSQKEKQNESNNDNNNLTKSKLNNP